MSASVAQVLELLNGLAPLELAEPWDNVGLLSGRPDAVVDRVLCALDLNAEVLAEAVDAGAQLIVTHHPILFRGRKNLAETDGEGRLLCALVRSGIALIAMHTNYDNACPGVNDALAAALGLSNVQVLGNGMRIGTVKQTDLGMFMKSVEVTLGGPVRMYGASDRIVCRVAVLGGAGEDYAQQAAAAFADVYVTGEMAYHKALDAVADGMCVLEAGHAATEHPGILALASALQNAADALQYDICVTDSLVRSYY